MKSAVFIENVLIKEETKSDVGKGYFLPLDNTLHKQQQQID